MLRLAVLSTLLLSTIYHSAAQYECPLINFQQTLTFNPDRKLNDHSPSINLEFINRSPINLALLDVHYSINNGPMENVRLFEKDNNQALNEASPLFMLEPSDDLTYRFTYMVDGIKLSCDTPTYHVTGKQSLVHAMEFNQVRSDSPVQAPSVSHAQATAPAVSEVHVQARIPVPSPSSASINQIVSQRSTVFNPDSIDDSAAKKSSSDHDARMSDVTAASLNPGVCPLIPFEEKLERVSKDSNQYSLSFINQSPTITLAYLDVHFSINNGPMANMRLYTDQSIDQPVNNNERALDGLTLIKGDNIKYSFSYGVNEPHLQARDQSSNLASNSKDLKIRACNTQVYDVKINE